MRKHEVLVDNSGFVTKGKLIYLSCDVCNVPISIENRPANGGEFSYREGEVVKRYDLCLECAVRLANTIESLETLAKGYAKSTKNDDARFPNNNW